MSRISAAVAALAVVGGLTSVSTEAAQRAFVSFGGSDGNVGTGCLILNPCRTFQAAHTAVDAGGEIIAMDTAGFGAVTITKSVTITTNPGYFAGIAASTGNAVTIATASVRVVLRGLNINGIGAQHGVLMTNGSGLTIENCVISGFTGEGISVFAPADVRVVNTIVRGNGGTGMWFKGGVNADVSDSKVLDNGWVGIWSYPDTTGNVTVSVSDTVSSGNLWGFNAPGTTVTSKMTLTRVTASNNSGTGVQTEGGYIAVSNSMITNNSTGMSNNAGTIETLNNSLIRSNTTNTSGTITSVGGG